MQTTRSGVALLAIAAMALAPPAALSASFLETVLKVAGISAMPSAQKGPSDDLDAAGEIWIANVAERTLLRVTGKGRYNSPVFLPGDQSILALSGLRLVRIPLQGGEVEPLYTLKGVSKLVGFNKENPDQVLVLFEETDGSPSLGFLSLRTGQVTPVPHDRTSREHRAMIAHIKQWDRVYGDTTLYVKSEIKERVAGAVEWTDVYIKRGTSAPVNLSRCDGMNCGQPALSHDGRQVVFVKMEP